MAEEGARAFSEVGHLREVVEGLRALLAAAAERRAEDLPSFHDDALGSDESASVLD